MSTYAVYFSPTRTNERNATAIAEVFGDVKHLNFTNPDKVQDVVMTKDDVAVLRLLSTADVSSRAQWNASAM